MGISPLATADFFASTPSQRKVLECAARKFLSDVMGIEVPDPKILETSFNEVAGSRAPPEVRQKIGALPLSVAENSCYGSLSFFAENMRRPESIASESAKKIVLELLNRKLCCSFFHPEFCEKTGLMGRALRPAIVALSGFEGLAVLRRMNLLAFSEVGKFVERYPGGDRVVVLEMGSWKGVIRKCREDPAYREVLKA